MFKVVKWVKWLAASCPPLHSFLLLWEVRLSSLGGTFFLPKRTKKGEELRGMKEGRGARLLSTSWLKLRFSKHPGLRQEHLWKCSLYKMKAKIRKCSDIYIHLSHTSFTHTNYFKPQTPPLGDRGFNTKGRSLLGTEDQTFLTHVFQATTKLQTTHKTLQIFHGICHTQTLTAPSTPRSRRLTYWQLQQNKLLILTPWKQCR